MTKAKELAHKIIKPSLIFMGFLLIYSLIFEAFIKIIPFFADKYNQLFDILALSISCLLLSFCFRSKLQQDFQNFLKNFKKNYRKYLKWYFQTYVVMIIVNVIIFLIVGDISTNEQLNEQNVLTSPLSGFINVCILAPFYEEILFRLNFRNLFKNKWSFAIITGLIFGSMHLLTATSLIECLYVIPYSLMGITLGLIYLDQENIFNSIFIHVFNNTLSIILLFL